MSQRLGGGWSQSLANQAGACWGTGSPSSWAETAPVGCSAPSRRLRLAVGSSSVPTSRTHQCGDPSEIGLDLRLEGGVWNPVSWGEGSTAGRGAQSPIVCFLTARTERPPWDQRARRSFANILFHLPHAYAVGMLSPISRTQNRSSKSWVIPPNSLSFQHRATETIITVVELYYMNMRVHSHTYLHILRVYVLQPPNCSRNFSALGNL